MQKFETLQKHSFVQRLIEDSISISKERNFKLNDIYLPEDTQLLEWEYHIHTTGFFTFHMMHLCVQLDSAIELLSNYKYSVKKSTVGRIAHLEYNFENYIIRVASVRDRTLQLVNAVFHLCMDEADVSERIILKNMKVVRTKIPALAIKLSKAIKRIAGDRNIIIHRHSYMNKDIRTLQLLYSEFILAGMIGKGLHNFDVKHFRRNRLNDYLKNIKTLMRKTNDEIFHILYEIFTQCETIYEKQKKLLKPNGS